MKISDSKSDETMTFIILLQFVLIAYLLIYNVSFIHKIERLQKQFQDFSSQEHTPTVVSESFPVSQEVEKSIKETKAVDSERDRDRELFEYINQTIIEQQLFLDPEFSREKFMKIGLINKNKVAQLLQQYANTNLNGYINNLRLEYALELIQNQPDLPIKAIAIDSGFNCSRTFYRFFQQKYGMTPAEYKDSLHGVS